MLGLHFGASLEDELVQGRLDGEEPEDEGDLLALGLLPKVPLKRLTRIFNLTVLNDQIEHLTIELLHCSLPQVIQPVLFDQMVDIKCL